MKRTLSIFIVLTLLLTALLPLTAYAQGEGNIDNGGGGMGSGTSENFWNTGDEGVRVTVVRASDHAVVTTPIDITNKHPDNIQAHFGKVSKISYTNGFSLTPSMQQYTYVNPAQTIPRIISSGSGNANIEAIKSYFTDEQVLRSIANLTGFNFETLINGDYKILLEPVAYMTFQGVRIAVTATEAAWRRMVTWSRKHGIYPATPGTPVHPRRSGRHPNSASTSAFSKTFSAATRTLTTGRSTPLRSCWASSTTNGASPTGAISTG